MAASSADRLQVLVAAIDQFDDSLPGRMNLRSDAIIANQCGQIGYRRLEHRGHRIDMHSFDHRGVGINRNEALMRASAEFCLLADDDMRYVDDYAERIIHSFETHPKSDLLIFNVHSPSVPRPHILKEHTVRWHSFMRFNTPRVAFRRRPLSEAGVYFNANFGGGTSRSAGEDTLFLADCLKRGLRITAVPSLIGEQTASRPSTWFRGYDEKYFIDKGYLFARLEPRLARPLCIQYGLRHYRRYRHSMSRKQALSLMLEGVRQSGKVRP